MGFARKLRRASGRKTAVQTKTGKLVRLDEHSPAITDNLAIQYGIGTGLPFIPAQAFAVEDLFTVPKAAVTKAVEPPPSPSTGPTGPRTAEGKAKSCLNNLRHGLAGAFRVLDHESQSEFDDLAEALRDEHQPATATEAILVQRLGEHAWLSRRAQNLQDAAILENSPHNLALFLRYQTTNDRAFYNCLAELARLRKEKRQFESQKPQPIEKKSGSALVTELRTVLGNEFTGSENESLDLIRTAAAVCRQQMIQKRAA